MDGVRQADFFLSKVDVQDGDLPPFLDIEGKYNEGATNSQFIGNAQKWLEHIEAKTGRQPIVYSTAAFLQEKLTGKNGKPPPWGKNYQVWVAQYPFSYSADGSFRPTQPVGWGDWVIWQYSGDHDSLEGIYKDPTRTNLVRVDLNVYRHSVEELYALAKAHPPVEVAAPAESSIPSQPTVEPSGPTPAPVTPVVETMPPSTAQPVSSTKTYIVQSGDTLWALSMRYGCTVDAIAQLNNIANPDLIVVGQVLQIPVA